MALYIPFFLKFNEKFNVKFTHFLIETVESVFLLCFQVIQ